MGKKIAVIYHADCPDGFGAAYAAWKKFGDKAEYFPVFRTDGSYPDILGKELYLLDYVYSKEEMADIAKKAGRVVIVDHHKTAAFIVDSFPGSLFDNDHSASVLAWKYFHPAQKIPKMFLYVEEGDLWRFSLPHSRIVARFLSELLPDFSLWDKTISEFEDEEGFANIVKKSESIAKMIDDEVAGIVSRAREVVFEGHKVLMVESPKRHSEVGNVLSQKMPPLGVIWQRENGKVRVSLRGDGTVDVSEIAKKYGGGGHKNAAGFVLENMEDLKKITGVSSVGILLSAD